MCLSFTIDYCEGRAEAEGSPGHSSGDHNTEADDDTEEAEDIHNHGTLIVLRVSEAQPRRVPSGVLGQVQEIWRSLQSPDLAVKNQT